MIGGSLGGPVALRRVGSRTVLVGGFGGIVAGIALLLTLPRDGLPVLTLIGSFLVMGLGLGAASVASTTVGTENVTENERGVAAGLLNSTAQLGTALGLAVTSPLVASAAPMAGYRLGFAAAALIGVAGGASVLTLPARRTRSASASAGAQLTGAAADGGGTPTG